MPPDESPSDLLDRLHRQRGRISQDTDPKGSPAAMMEQIKKRNKERQKEQFGVLTRVYRSLALLVIGILVIFIVLGTPVLQYIFPVSNVATSVNSSDMPDTSMNSYLQSAGLEVSEDIRLLNTELQHDNGHSWIEGEVQNTAGRQYRGVALYYDLYDATGQSLGTPYILIGNLAAGESKTFRTNPVNGVATTAELTCVLGS
jgi:hypothetical protein